ncbi:lysophospholipid acyltransferase family protein [Pseudoalteromonas sp. S16_S37]|uniref:lysophospholipid acyltransferase family protein n=1 Tax=Pseudoalteromonas sp. S16_S37 TaxID=2720228 RepID=UPI001680DAC5|nr:lysophospholipid acyltransferase family protein [Pseudoalteromonas sp. S16_S37]MBD1581155.1 acyltransferase [Pseudoalteromonas sp. S16_S37]
MTDIPKQIPRTSGRLSRLLGALVLKLLGWRIVGAFPNHNKFVAAVAPHTSNWDFFIAISVKLSLGIEIKFLGKHSIFIGPFGWLLKKLGGIPVERSHAHGMVKQVSDIFKQSDALILGIAPEGTRKKTPQWKCGFLHIAKSANVPIVPMALDYRTKTFVIMSPYYISDDIPQELQKIIALFDKNMAKYPNQVSGS